MLFKEEGLGTFKAISIVQCAVLTILILDKFYYCRTHLAPSHIAQYLLMSNPPYVLLLLAPYSACAVLNSEQSSWHSPPPGHIWPLLRMRSTGTYF